MEIFIKNLKKKLGRTEKKLYLISINLNSKSNLDSTPSI